MAGEAAGGAPAQVPLAEPSNGLLVQVGVQARRCSERAMPRASHPLAQTAAS